MTSKKQKIPADCLPRCSSCAFFIDDPREEVGECRRMPPQVFPDGEDGLGFSFAITSKEAWCGEYRRKCDS